MCRQTSIMKFIRTLVILFLTLFFQLTCWSQTFYYSNGKKILLKHDSTNIIISIDPKEDTKALFDETINNFKITSSKIFGNSKILSIRPF
jgi:cell division protein YceG involved in septum cleavage